MGIVHLVVIMEALLVIVPQCLQIDILITLDKILQPLIGIQLRILIIIMCDGDRKVLLHGVTKQALEIQHSILFQISRVILLMNGK